MQKNNLFKIISIILLLILLIPTFGFSAENPEEEFSLNIPESEVIFKYNPEEQKELQFPDIGSHSAIIADPKTDKIFFEKNAYEEVFPASTTKILTALLVIEKCNLDDMAKASKKAIELVPEGYTTANIKEDEELSIKDLLNVLLIPSANEAANILAEYVSGSVEEFANLMNNRAKELGCKNSHFVNPNGIHNDNHFSSAYDLYLIAKECQKHDIFNEIVKTKSYTLPKTNRYLIEDRTFTNTNSLILPNSKSYYYEYATGMKTGSTTQAGQCLIASSSKDDLDLICVVLGGGTNKQGLNERFIDPVNLFESVYNNYTVSKIAEKYDIVQSYIIDKATKETETLDAVINADISTIVPNDTKLSNENYQIDLNRKLGAPIKKGDKLGTITIKVDGLNYTTDIFAGNDVNKQFNFIMFFGIIFGIIIVLFTIRSINIRAKKKKNLKRKSYNRKKRMKY